MVNTNYVRRKGKDELNIKACVRKYVKDNLSCKCYEHALVFPFKSFTMGGVCDQEGRFISNSSLHERLDNNVYKYKENEIIESDEEAIFIGTLCNIYGHAITDNLKKIWFLKTDSFKSLVNNGCKIVYLNCIYTNPLTELVLRILRYSGVNIEEIYEVRQITRFKKLYIPDDSSRYDPDTDIRYYTKEFKETINDIKRGIVFNGNIYDKLYFSRAHYSSIKDIGNGEVTIEKFFSDQGYKVIYPEKHSFEEQIGMLMHCGSFAASEGSVSHNSIFCNDGVNIIILRKSNWINPYQLAINEMINANVTYVDAHHSIIKKNEPWIGPFYMYPTRELTNFLCINSSSIKNRWLKKDWYKYLFEVLKFRFQRSCPFTYSIVKKIKHLF